MPFIPKPYVKVGTKDWEAIIPRPPKHATHARMTCVDPTASDPAPKVATLPIRDFGCFKGVSGEFSYIRMDNKRKVSKEYDGVWYWDGYVVPDVELMIKENE